jgi:mRNA-degrading endonuclease toxin of MazEF toxin-antitoxin module
VSTPERGEVWLADLGFAAKVRPALVVSVPFADRDYALIEAVPHTTQKRGEQFEIAHESQEGIELKGESEQSVVSDQLPVIFWMSTGFTRDLSDHGRRGMVPT